MQFRVVIPEHIRSGQYIKVHCPPDGKGSKGREAELRVPKGLKPGDTFVFDISDKDNSIIIANDVDLLNLQLAAAANGGSGGNKNLGGHNNIGSQNDGSTFLDREVLHLKDFLVALGIGLVIGVSIVVGFVLGVLSATSGIQESADGTLLYTAGGEVVAGGISPKAGLYQLQSIRELQSWGGSSRNLQTDQLHQEL